MNSKEFKAELTSVTPDIPEHFHDRMEMTLRASHHRRLT